MRKPIKSIEYGRLLAEALSRKPGLTRAGLAKAFGRDPSVISHIVTGRRELKAHEIPIIEAYIGEPLIPEVAAPIGTIACAGRIGPAWYEAGSMPASADGLATYPVWGEVGRQSFWVLDVAVPGIGATAGSILITRSMEKDRPLRQGDVIVVKRARDGFESLGIARVGDRGAITLLTGTGTGEAGVPVALAIELRVTM